MHQNNQHLASSNPQAGRIRIQFSISGPNQTLPIFVSRFACEDGCANYGTSLSMLIYIHINVCHTNHFYPSILFFFFLLYLFALIVFAYGVIFIVSVTFFIPFLVFGAHFFLEPVFFLQGRACFFIISLHRFSCVLFINLLSVLFFFSSCYVHFFLTRLPPQYLLPFSPIVPLQPANPKQNHIKHLPTSQHQNLLYMQPQQNLSFPRKEHK